MAYDANDSVVQTGSGRSKLPARLRAANFAATVAAAVLASPKGLQLKSYTTGQRTALSMVAGDKGTLVFDDDLDQAVLWDGAAWVNPDGTALA